MAIKRKWSRIGKGQNMQIFVSKPINYTAQTVYSGFVANAAIGEIGVFNNANTDPAVQTTLLAAGAKFFIAQKVTGGTKRTPVYTMTNEATPRKILTVAAVNQTSSIGWNGAAGNFNNGTIVVNTNNNLQIYPSNFEFEILEMTEGNDPYPNWNYNYAPKTGDTVVEIAGQLAKLVNDTTNPVYRNNLPLVTAQVLSNGTITAPYTMTGTTPTMTFQNGSSTVLFGGTTPALVGIVLNDYIILNAGTGVPTNAINDTYKVIGINAGVSITLDRAWGQPTQIITGANVPTFIKKTVTVTNIGLLFIAINPNETFRLAVRGDLLAADRFDSLTYTRGLGISDQVFQLEAEALLFQGNTARNTVFGDAAYGNPDTFTVDGAVYDYFYFDIIRAVTLTNTFAGGNASAEVLVAANTSNTSVKTNFQTIFGV